VVDLPLREAYKVTVRSEIIHNGHQAKGPQIPLIAHCQGKMAVKQWCGAVFRCGSPYVADDRVPHLHDL